MNSRNQPSTTELPAFYKLSTEYFGAETMWNHATDFLVFTLLGLVTAWPIVLMIVAVSRLLRTY
jgi:hypothetical protein